MAYGDSAARVRKAKDKLTYTQWPGAYADAIDLAIKRGAKTQKQIESEAKLIVQNRRNDASKNVTRAKMQDPNVKLGKRFASAQTSKKAASKPTTKKAGKK